MTRNVAVWSKRLRELRQANNLLQTDVAKVLRCSQVACGMYELGKRRISVDNLVKLARYYHVSLDYLAGLQDQG
ncbi:helix-turn-helix domain-containing protein [Mitsuokella jalaludinii]|uniref:helix-turn-helix domain-containing protein n=1 Tax=Mitsuokella jalaludinii TaxID=187979 RepID=UPI003D0624CE